MRLSINHTLKAITLKAFLTNFYHYLMKIEGFFAE